MLMEELTVIIKELEAIENELQFEHFDSNAAMRIGIVLYMEVSAKWRFV